MLITSDLQAAVAGILRGSGRQLLGAIVNFLSYFVLGLPLAIVLALPAGLGTLGIWIALASANFIQVRATLSNLFSGLSHPDFSHSLLHGCEIKCERVSPWYEARPGVRPYSRLQAGVYLVAVWRTDWERQAQQAQKEAMAAGRGEGQIEGLPQGEGEGGEWQREGSQEKGDINCHGAIGQAAMNT